MNLWRLFIQSMTGIIGLKGSNIYCAHNYICDRILHYITSREMAENMHGRHANNSASGINMLVLMKWYSLQCEEAAISISLYKGSSQSKICKVNLLAFC